MIPQQVKNNLIEGLLKQRGTEKENTWFKVNNIVGKKNTDVSKTERYYRRLKHKKEAQPWQSQSNST